MQENTTNTTPFLVKKSEKNSNNKKFQTKQQLQNINNFIVILFIFLVFFTRNTHKLWTRYNKFKHSTTISTTITTNFCKLATILKSHQILLTNFLSKLAKWQQKTHNVNTKHKIVCVVVDERKHFSHTHSYTTTFVSFLRHISWQNSFSTKILVNLSQITTTFLLVFFLFYIFCCNMR